jgi:hypothetical protein
MGIFFKAAKHKSSKPVQIVRLTLVAGMVLLFAAAFLKDFASTYIGLMFILGGVSFLMNGIESHYYKEAKSVYLGEYGFAVLWFLLSYQLIF